MPAGAGGRAHVTTNGDHLLDNWNDSIPVDRHDHLGQVSPNLGDIWPLLLPAALGVVLALPVWLRGLIAAANLRAWWWYLFLCVFLWALPVATLVNAIAGPMLPAAVGTRAEAEAFEFD